MTNDERIYSLDQLRSRYHQLTARVTADCSLATQLVGGQPASEEGVRQYVKHHLGLDGAEAADAIRRILTEEVGEREVPYIDANGVEQPGELKEKLSYGINVVRRHAIHGPYLGNWMPKACLKAAASRLGIFVQKRGSKGDLAEMGQIMAVGCSLADPETPERIYLRSREGEQAAETYFTTFRGRVQSPQGSKSIISDNECVAVGSRFAFELRYMPTKIKETDIADIFACAMVIGLGSAKSFECGKFSINRLTFQGIEKDKAA